MTRIYVEGVVAITTSEISPRTYKTSEEKRRRSTEYRAKHAEERNAYHKQWRTENKEKFAASLAARRARKKDATGKFSGEQWKALNDAFGWRCLRCGVTHEVSPVTKDHVVPLSQGGTNDIGNIQPLCRPCNLWKNARSIDYRVQMPAEHAAAKVALAPMMGRKRAPPTPASRSRIAATLTGFKHSNLSRQNTAAGVKDSWTRRGPRSDSTSGVRGVTWDSESGKWCASVTTDRKKKRLGRFTSIAEAANAIAKFKGQQL